MGLKDLSGEGNEKKKALVGVYCLPPNELIRPELAKTGIAAERELATWLLWFIEEQFADDEDEDMAAAAAAAAAAASDEGTLRSTGEALGVLQWELLAAANCATAALLVLEWAPLGRRVLQA